DLSNNNLTGGVPEFLTRLQFLTLINLQGNALNGSVPAGLIDRINRRFLQLNVEGNQIPCTWEPCTTGTKTSENSVVVTVVASVASVLSVVIIVSALLWWFKRTKTSGKLVVTPRKLFQELKNRQFTYSDIQRITNNFEKVIGKGGFGTVYHGFLDDNQVAVKMLSKTSFQGYRQFEAEVELLLRVHHRNLTALIGYCDDGTETGLIYEFMAKGNLAEFFRFLDSSISVLNWEGRLGIALEAAQGLEYLHHGCKPPIIHRDVKSSNILLTDNLQAKLSDFGYSTTNRLTEKSDVYSFGVVLLEIITNRPVIARTIDEPTHISRWVGSMLSNGDIENIVDSRLKGDFEINSVWRAIEVAMACLSPASTKRPTMNHVVTELSECLVAEINRTRGVDEDESRDMMTMASLNCDSDIIPLPSVEGNQIPCTWESCTAGTKTSKNSVVVTVVASVASVLSVVIIVSALLWWFKRTKTSGKLVVTPRKLYQELKNRQFTYSDIQRITNNFEKVIGKGGFGTVYHGFLDGNQVAVKMLSKTSFQGYKQFEAEVELLLRVHHRNLTALIGYCDDGTETGLIYEFMAKGNLAEYLSDSSISVLNWEGRLGIALEAAQGLEYLHHGCKPPIIDRDVKSSNILLTDNLQAKLSDFGLSKSFEGGSHVSTVIAGTPGYLDPEYSTTNRLTEKSDVYSFGVVLLEIITNRPVIARTIDEPTHISRWVGSMLSNGDIENIVDSRLKGDFEINSVWRAIEVAMACLSPASTKRPTMNHIVTELSECLVAEINRTRGVDEDESRDMMAMASLNCDSDIIPLPR
ncbi:hypothetical protein Gotur_017366, partial [Gossypium turneri]